MNSFLSPKNDDAEVSPVMVVALALFFTSAILALVYLSDYSMGREFADQAPHFRPAVVASSQQ